MRSVPAFCLVALLLASSSFARAPRVGPDRQQPSSASRQAVARPQAKADFSGTWILDTERSSIRAPERERLPAETLVVKQTATELSFNLDLGDGASSQTVRIDGEKTVPAGRDGMTHELEARWKADQLVMTAEASRRSFVRVSILVWSISADGKQLTVMGTSVDRSTARPNETISSEVKTTRVYRKQ